MSRGGTRDNIIIGLMIILTYFLIYTFLGTSSILASMGGLPLINCVSSLIENGFSGAVFAVLTKDFAQTIIVVYIVVFVQNLLPQGNHRGASAVVGIIVGYMVLYLVSLWVVRYVIFTNAMSGIIQMFVSIFSVVVSGLGALVTSPLRRLIVQHQAREYLTNYFMDSRITHWLADSFFIATVILFLAVAIEMTVGLSFFFSALFIGFPSIVTIIVMFVLLYAMICI